MEELAKIDQAACVIRARWAHRPPVGIVLGTGLGEFSDQIETPTNIAYQDVPHVRPASALSHRGRFVCGHVAGLPVITMDGRLHSYEGHSWGQVTFPIRLMRALGVRLLILSNASGGLNPALAAGDVMIIEDHIDLMGFQPRAGRPTKTAARPRPAGGQLYASTLVQQGIQVARQKKISVFCGVYAALRGPNYETRAEYRFLRRIGADVVGMSTVPEVMVAAELGLQVFALSVVTNESRPDSPDPTDAATVVAKAAAAEPRVREIVLGMLDHQQHESPTDD